MSGLDNIEPKQTRLNALSYFVAVILFVVGLMKIFTNVDGLGATGGMLICLGSLLLLEPFYTAFDQKYDLGIPRIVFAGVGLVLAGMGFFIASKQANTDDPIVASSITQPVQQKQVEQVLPTVKSSNEKPQPEVQQDDQKALALKYFKDGNEPKVKDALWTSSFMFKVGVIDDGSNRDGYAEYVCGLLRDDYQITDSTLMVQVIDISKLVKQGEWIKLGEASCR